MGYYRAGGFMDILGAGAGIASSFFPAAAPLIGFGSKVVSGIFGGSKQDAPLINALLGQKGIQAKTVGQSVQPGTIGAAAAASATPLAQSVGRGAELFTLNQAPGKMPMEGSAPGAAAYSAATQGAGNDQLLLLLLQLLGGGKTKRKKKKGRRY